LKINIFILCYNEEVLIKSTILHYKKYLPSANIIILDNKSTDNSVNIAKSFNCNIVEWESPNYKNCIDDFEYKKN
jgi:glycosyltransferase involved in cell wall biosynthesis